MILAIISAGCATAPRTRIELDPHISADAVLIPTEIESGELGGMSVRVAPIQAVEEGTYFFRGGFSALILELDGGRYRYWFSSDVITGNEPTYPLTGKYVAEGAVVRLEHRQPSMQDIWLFRKLNEQTTLWRPNAVKWWHEERSFDSYGILYPTKLKPEEIWGKNVWKTKPWD